MALVGTVDPRNVILMQNDGREPSLPLALSAMATGEDGRPLGLVAQNGDVYNVTPDGLPLFVVYKDGGCEIRKALRIDTIMDARFIIAGSMLIMDNGENVIDTKDHSKTYRIALGARHSGKLIIAAGTYTPEELFTVMEVMGARDAMQTACGDTTYVNYTKGGIKVGNRAPILVLEAKDFKDLIHPVIIIDPGHGGKDPGGRGFNKNEKDYALQGAKIVYEELLKYHCTPLLTRVDDVVVSLSDRTNMSNAIDADFFYSIHLNAGGGEGFETFTHPNASAMSKMVQRSVHAEVMGLLAPYGVKDRGIKTANHHVTRETTCPSMLVENLFMDNALDAKLLANNDFIKELFKANARGIVKGLSLKTKAVVEKEDDEYLYKVQICATTFKNKAEVCLDKARALGFTDAFIQREINKK